MADGPSGEWLVERGIGETRAALVVGDTIVAARIRLDDLLAAGTVAVARLASVGHGGRNAVARLPDGTELLLPRRPAGVSEGAAVTVEVVREAIPGGEPWKRPLARQAAAVPAPAASVADQLRGSGAPVRELIFPDPGGDPLDAVGWSDLLAEAAIGLVAFPGGQLRISPTPAMTLIDVDGTLPADELALAGAAAAGRAIRRLDIGGSIGIDLPTVAGRAARQAAGDRLDAAMAGCRFERTAVNGFGFVQLVRPRTHASLLELFLGDRPGAEARALLRRAARRSGAIRLRAHPAVIAVLAERRDWLERLARQVGGAVDLCSDPRLAMAGGNAEAAS